MMMIDYLINATDDYCIVCVASATQCGGIDIVAHTAGANVSEACMYICVQAALLVCIYVHVCCICALIQICTNIEMLIPWLLPSVLLM